MYPTYFDGDLILCVEPTSEIKSLVGLEAAVSTGDGRRYVKRILKGAVEDTYDLESHNAPPIRGVTIDWGAEVEMIVRRSNQRLINRSARRPT